MSALALEVLHITVLGYWLGSELVINSTYRYVSYSASMPFGERNRLMDHVMDVDQHVRYALVLQLTLGTMLLALYGYVPGGAALATIAAAAGAGWLTLVELTHRWRNRPSGLRLAAIDRGLRYVAMLALLALAAAIAVGALTLPHWLGWKLAAFAGVIACGLGIRLALTGFYRIWQVIAREGSNAELEAGIRRTYVQATSVLFGLWALIALIVALSVWKPSQGTQLRIDTFAQGEADVVDPGTEVLAHRHCDDLLFGIDEERRACEPAPGQIAG